MENERDKIERSIDRFDWDYASGLTWGNLQAYIRKQLSSLWKEYYRLTKVIYEMNSRIKHLKTSIEEQKEVTAQIKLINEIIKMSEKDSARAS